ncbi:hypothetical protein [Massilia sp. BHUDP2]|uniref:hypothetical protein n=1 Tax=Massilia sp. BHUDP2 TaxID=3034505 RepID=UPI003906356F
MNATAASTAAQALPAVVNGVEVSRLLAGLSETNASSSHLELFSRCLGAYIVLSAIYGGGAA